MASEMFITYDIGELLMESLMASKIRSILS
jgi:hypothetical protein